MTYSLGEILEELRDLDKEAALAHLKKNKSPALWLILKETLTPESFDKGVLDVQWKPSPKPMGLADNNLYFELKRLYIFKTDSIVPLARKKIIFTQILESLHKMESGVLLSLVSGTFYNRYSSVTPNDIRNLITLS
jgi:hypothetical protein